MPKHLAFTYKGKNYANLKILCETVSDLKMHTVRYRLKTGWSLHKALTTPLKVTTSKSITFKGKKYTSEAELARTFNIDYNIYCARKRNGWNMNERLGLKPRINRPSDKCDGIIYMLKNIVTKKCYIGLTTTPLRKRFRQHISRAKSSRSKLSVALREYGPDVFVISIIAKSNSRMQLSKIEKKYIAKYDSYKNGYNSDKGGNLGGASIGSSNKQVLFKGKVYPSVAELCRTFKVSRSLFEARHKRMRWSLDRALGVAKY